MKKRVFWMLLAAMVMPFAVNAQSNAGTHIDTTVDACGTYTWNVNGTTYANSGVYTQVIGDSLFILDLTIRPSYNTNDNVTAGCSYTWGGTTYTQSGVYTHQFSSIYGCDSNVTLTLTIASANYATYTVTACHDYTWKGTTYTESGTYNVTDDSQACDSSLTLNLTILPSVSAVYTANACEQYVWKGQTYTASGTINITDTTHSGCDSLLTLNLTIRQPEQKYRDTTVTGCEYGVFRFLNTSPNFYIYENGFDTTSWTYFHSTAALRNTFHPRTMERCFDSVIRVHFVINDIKNTQIQAMACDIYSDTIGGELRTYNYSTIDTIKIGRAANGCDSNVIVNLTIRKSPVITIDGDLRVTPGSSATLTAKSDQSNTSFVWMNNSTSSSITLNNVTGNTDVSVTGTNTTTGCSNTAHVTVMANVGINEADANLIQLYPNPTSAMVNIASEEAVQSVSIFNLNGQQVMQAGNVNNINLQSLANGTYVVRVTLQSGATATRRVVVSR